ncbi:MAG: acyl-CoA thioesterase [Oligoflexia bacterium]|nr:acyl-CoA thioesterase [Oligoflexia bacterium]
MKNKNSWQISSRLVKSEDLNHHGTLFAGRMTEWFVESSFAAASMLFGHPENIVCFKIHYMNFKTPIQKGDIVHIAAKVLRVSRSSFTVYAKVTTLNHPDQLAIDGVTLFVCVDKNGKKMEHGLVLDPPTDENEIKILQDLLTKKP